MQTIFNETGLSIIYLVVGAAYIGLIQFFMQAVL